MLSDEELNDILRTDCCERDTELLKVACSELMRSFDSVQVFANRHEVGSGGTVRGSYGAGNFFARYGHVKEWIKQQEGAFQEDGEDF